MNRKIKLLAAIFGMLLPSTTSAAFTKAQGLGGDALSVVNALIGIAFAAALLVFFYGVAKFIFRIGGDEKAVSGGRTLMVWGIIALFVISSIFGIVHFLQNEVGVDANKGIETSPNN